MWDFYGLSDWNGHYPWEDLMIATMKRVIVFVADVEKCEDFYRAMFDLSPIESDLAADEWAELDAGGCRLAFHKAHGVDGPTGRSADPHKIVFYAEDVGAVQQELVRRGAPMDAVKTFGDLLLCDGSDPEGHRFQISNRA